MAKSLLVFCLVLATSVAVPVSNSETGLGAALSSIAHSVVLISEDTLPDKASTIQADVPPVQLESANVLPSLTLIALTPETHNVVAETEKLVYSNDTDAKGVIKITVVTPTVTFEDSAEETTTETTATTEAHTVRDEEETTPPESDTEITTNKPEEVTRPSTVALPSLTVLGIGEINKQTEEEIKETIKEVEAMPVILTVGV